MKQHRFWAWGAVICMIMVMVIVFEIQNKGFKPELNRDRTLYVKDVAITHKNEEDGGMNYSLVGGRVAKECFFTLKTPEAVSMQLMRMQTLVTSTDQTRRMKCDQIRTDEGFWKIFDFEFLAGKPFLRSDVESNIKKAVISRRLALRIFGLADESVIGQTILVARRPYVVGGIVEDVSPLANRAYAQIWIPYAQSDVDRLINEETLEGLIGSYRVLILARSSGDFNKIKTEVEQNVARFNNSLQELKIDLMKQPDTQCRECWGSMRWS